MRNYLVLSIVFLITLSVSGQTIKFNETTHDFGTFREEKGKVKCIFSFENTGNKPLVVSQVRPSCGCTVADFTKIPVKPGEKGIVEATYVASGRPGPFHKAITVITNDTKTPNIILYIKGKVTPRKKTKVDLYPVAMGLLRFKTNHLAFMEIRNNEIRKDTLDVYNHSHKQMTINLDETYDHLKMDEVVLGPDSTGYLIIEYNAKKKNDWGLIFDRVILRTNDSMQPKKTITVSAKIVEDFGNVTEKKLKKAPNAHFETITFDFGEVQGGEKVKGEFKFTNTGKKKLYVRKVKAACGCTAIQPSQKILKKGESSTIGFVLNTGGYRGKQHKTITVITNDPDRPEIVLSILGTVMQ